MAKRRRKPPTELTLPDTVPPANTPLLADLRQLIDAARQQTARAVNSALVGMYWHIGRRNLFQMVQFAEVFPEKRIVSALSTQLSWSHFVEILPITVQGTILEELRERITGFVVACIDEPEDIDVSLALAHNWGVDQRRQLFQNNSVSKRTVQRHLPSTSNRRCARAMEKHRMTNDQ